MSEQQTITVRFDVNTHHDQAKTDELSSIIESVTCAVMGNGTTTIEDDGIAGVCPIDGARLAAHLDHVSLSVPARMFVCESDPGHTFGLIYGDPDGN
jgi:hypothetical protein